ncbi:MAG: hypothetical protein QOJ50_1537 [Cryptosporangiaceae bacterium]|jgi:hypothetical protein|nr:hypothetical protein [Cryptosporangiaceae bacterium]
MRNQIAVASAAAVLLLVPGCGRHGGPIEANWEVTGAKGATADITVHTKPDPDGQGGGDDELKATRVPYKRVGVANAGPTSIEATPSTGALTCRILVEGHEVAKVVGQPGQPVRCAATVK